VPDNDHLLPVVVAGNIVLDMFPPLELPDGYQLCDLLVGGQTIEVGALTTSPGGVVPNTGISLHKLGVPVRVMGQVAGDLPGRELRDLLRASGLDTTYLSESKGSTSYTFVLALPDTDRIFLHYPGPAKTFSTAVIAWEAIADAGIFHLGYPPLMPLLYANNGAQLAGLMRQAKALGATTSLDMCMLPPASEGARQDWRAILRATLPHVDLFLPSVEEILLLLQPDRYAALTAAGGDITTGLGAEDFSRLAGELLEMGAGIVGLKAGRSGLYVRTASAERLASFGRAAPAGVTGWANRELWDPGYKPRRIATATGAGDAAVAGFLAALIRGLPLEGALRCACALGAQNLEAPDATSSIRSWEETMRAINAGWEKNEMDRAMPGWHYDETWGQWRGPHDTCTEAETGGAPNGAG